MSHLSNLLNLSPIITDTFKYIQAGLVVIMAISCFVLIVGVLVSPPETGIGNNVITGAAESYYTRNKGKNNQGRVRLMVIVCASIIAVCAVLYFVLYGVYPGQ